MPTLKRLQNIMKYGVGPGAKARKKADKQAAREARFNTELWRRDTDTDTDTEVAQRQYASYEEYTSHQRSKLDNIIDRLKEKEHKDFVVFKEDFSNCKELQAGSTVLCLGARLDPRVANP